MLDYDGEGSDKGSGWGSYLKYYCQTYINANNEKLTWEKNLYNSGINLKNIYHHNDKATIDQESKFEAEQQLYCCWDSSEP